MLTDVGLEAMKLESQVSVSSRLSEAEGPPSTVSKVEIPPGSNAPKEGLELSA